MRRISKMYQWSGGTDYRHTCYECKNCVKVDPKKTTCKCLIYGEEGPETDWKPHYIACKAYNQTPPDIPVSEMRRIKPELVIKGQMSIFDLLKEEK